jgi:2-C-methyl-D-erythritol 4-phosphate cytidylyltransferase
VDVWAVLVAAGRGERLGGDRPKAFAPLAGHPLLAESLRRLDACESIGAIVVVAPPDWEEPAILLAEEFGASKVSSVVTGGTRSRSESVRIGVEEVPDTAEAIVVHDAARPLVSDEVVERVLAPLAEGCDGAVPGLAVADTVKRAPGGVVAETVDRRDLYVVQTPQAFRAGALRAALAGSDADATDCAGYVERAGGRVAVVPGDPALLKVTDAGDLATVERLLRNEAS